MSDELLGAIRKAVWEFNSWKYFECHETLEDSWRVEKDESTRDFLQGLIHLAVAMHHRHEGNLNGAGRQLQKAFRRWQNANLPEINKRCGFDFVALKKEAEGLRENPEGQLRIQSIGSAGSP